MNRSLHANVCRRHAGTAPASRVFTNYFIFKHADTTCRVFQGFSNPFPKFSTTNGVCGILGIRA
ncbi:Os04g0253601 [Oryza sativa Japonica Group]|uniref:Os04g0253601 protein n=1 Tax=Oryza sativa subsp. japonica TaxID=39947 RepID=A0A0P0W7V9_ORYSJ|nr:Os04g0253601 [Oryza sativa Japonica Group]